MGKIFLVTGAAGFIGSSVAKKLISEGNQVITIDNLSTGYKSNIPNEVVFYQGDCQDEKIVSKLEQYKFDAIFHIAGQSSGEISFDNPVYDLQTNAQSTLMLLKLAIKTGCNKFIYASTMSVYGEQPDKLINENAPIVPISFYGVGKVASEQYLRIYQQQYGIQCSALRLFNVYGPGQNLENLRQGMVSIFLAMAIKNKYIHVKGSPDRFRDFVYIDDVVNAFLQSYNIDNETFRIINICTGEKTTIRQLNKTIISMIPFSISIKYEGNTPGDQFGITGNNSKAQKMIKWQPRYKLNEGLKRMIEWALNNSKH